MRTWKEGLVKRRGGGRKLIRYHLAPPAPELRFDLESQERILDLYKKTKMVWGLLFPLSMLRHWTLLIHKSVFDSQLDWNLHKERNFTDLFTTISSAPTSVPGAPYLLRNVCEMKSTLYKTHQPFLANRIILF